MENTYLIIIIVILILILIYKKKSLSQTENFNLLDTGIENNNCYAKSLDECVEYSNCGIATIDGKQQCIPGDIEGPSFELNTKFNQWSYKNKYDGHIFNAVDDTRDYDIYATFYPSEYEIFYPSPTCRSALF